MWDWYAFFYDSVRTLLPYQELLKKTVTALDIREDGVQILDAGCGTGNLADALSSAKVSVHGADGSSAMLKRAKAKTLRCANPVRYIKADFNQPLPYRDGVFDGVVSLNVLYALRDPRSALRELHRVLKFGGLLVLATPTVEPKIRNIFGAHLSLLTQAQWLKKLLYWVKTIASLPSQTCMTAFNLMIKRRAARREFHFFDASELAALLQENGFHILRCEPAYGGTDSFVVAAKALTVTDKMGRSLSIEIARSTEDLAAVHDLRYDVYCVETRYLDPREYPHKQERDRYDPYSVHIIARNGAGVIGTLRMIKDSPHGFLMEESFTLPDYVDRSRTLEHSRAAVHKNYRNISLHKIMIEAAYVWQRENGYHTCIGAGVDQVSAMLLKRGWKQIGESKMYHGARATPILFSLDHSP